MSKFVERLKRYYITGRYTKSQIADFLEVGLIAPDEYEYIVGEPYKKED